MDSAFLVSLAAAVEQRAYLPAYNMNVNIEDLNPFVIQTFNPLNVNQSTSGNIMVTTNLLYTDFRNLFKIDLSSFYVKKKQNKIKKNVKISINNYKRNENIKKHVFSKLRKKQ